MISAVGAVFGRFPRCRPSAGVPYAGPFVGVASFFYQSCRLLAFIDIRIPTLIQMTRFIFSWMLVLGCAGFFPLHAGLNSKRPASLPPTPLTKSPTAETVVAATVKVAQAAKTLAKASGAVISGEVTQAAAKAKKLASASGKALGNGLARVTAYWSGEGDYYTRRHISATGIILHQGHCAVDPTVIPYGSVVHIEGLGTYLAVDTGTAVVSRRAARQSGHNKNERHALVVDIYFESRKDGERFAEGGPKFALVTWSTPQKVASAGESTHTLVAFEDTSRNKAL